MPEVGALNLGLMQTEAVNMSTLRIDQSSTLDVVKIMNDEDSSIASSITPFLPVIAEAIDDVVDRIRKGGRVLYFGAGTSGRLGVLDASEIPPTFSAPKDQFVAVIAGGDSAIRHAQEGAEDSPVGALKDITALNVSEKDMVIGIASSGRTPYVLTALKRAKEIGCSTIGISCVSPSELSVASDYMINPITGPEVVTGSTRLKAGTATKMILNMISTGSMIKTGKTYGNLMVDLRATNHKLQCRAHSIIRKTCGNRIFIPDSNGSIVTRRLDTKDSTDAIASLLELCDGKIKLAIMVGTCGCTVSQASTLLNNANGSLASAIASFEDSAIRRKPQCTELNGETDIIQEIDPKRCVLCVDAGGSKCSAVILNSSGCYAKGYGGPCNHASHGTGNVLREMAVAIEAAFAIFVSNLGLTRPSSDIKHHCIAQLGYVWIAMAGIGTKAESIDFKESFIRYFELQRPDMVKITSDITLLGSHLHNHTNKQAVALIAGTGSIAVHFAKNSRGQVEQVARSGGWGSTLGDDGGGFKIGLKAIQCTLSRIDHVNSQKSIGIEQDLDSLHSRVLEHFETTPADLLRTLIGLGINNITVSGSLKKQIADLSRDVFEEAFEQTTPDRDALEIVSQASMHMAQSIKPFVNARLDPAQSLLILSGSLLCHKSFGALVIQTLREQGLTFAECVVADDAALTSAKNSLEHIVH